MLRDLRHSVRLLRKTPGFTAVAVLVLALGIGANAAVFSLVNALVLQPQTGTDRPAGRRLQPRPRQARSVPRFLVSAPTLDLRDRSGVFESLMAHTFSIIGVGEGDSTKQAFASIVSSNYFTTLGVPLAAGRAFTAEEERPGARRRWRSRRTASGAMPATRPSFIGSTVRVNGTPFTVVGVAPRGFAGTMAIMSPQWWFPLGSFDVVVNEWFKQRATGLNDRGHYALNLVGMLKPGIAAAAADPALDRFAKRLDGEYAGTDHDQTFVLGGVPRTGVSSSPESGNAMSVVSALLTLMAALVLVVACLNLANLLLARGAARRKEIAIRQALGSGRRRVIQQLLAEGLTLSAMGAACGVVIGWWASRALTRVAGQRAAARCRGRRRAVVAVDPCRLCARRLQHAVLRARTGLGAVTTGGRRPISRTTPAAGGAGVATGPLLVIGQLAVSLALVAAGGLFVRAAINAAQRRSRLRA